MKTTTTTIEIPTKLLSLLVNSDALDVAIMHIDEVASSHRGKENQLWCGWVSQLSDIRGILTSTYESEMSKRREHAPTDDALLATFVRTLLAEMGEDAFWEFVVNHREETRAKLAKLTLDDQRLGWDIERELSLDIFDLDLDRVLELTLEEFGIRGNYDTVLGGRVDRMLHSFLYADINYKGEIV